MSSRSLRRAAFAIGVVLTATIPAGSDETADGWRVATPSYTWSFPADHGAHPDYRTEWWYLTGHVESVEEPVRRFGYQFTIFRVGLVPPGDVPELRSDWSTQALILGHAGLSELDEGRHRFAEVLHRSSVRLGEFTDAEGMRSWEGAAGADSARPIAWCLPPPGTQEPWSIAWNGSAFDFVATDRQEGFGLELSTTPAKPLVLQGPNGFSRKGDREDAASLYYSFTRLATEGVVIVDGERIRVRGESWMDKEFGSNQLSEHQEGWDWFSLQLEDGRELMLYQLRGEGGRSDYAFGTVVGEAGETTFLTVDDWDLEVTGAWRSPETAAEYPSGWRIVIASLDLDLEVEPWFEQQENVATGSAGLFYWEGAVEIRDSRSGDVRGRGYVELTGYGDGGTPGI